MLVNILFVCSKNRWRSLTAEHIFQQLPDHSVRSAGTSLDARVRVGPALLAWADLILVMEKKHQLILQEKFAPEIAHKRVVCLNIPDEFTYMDPALIELLQLQLPAVLATT